MFIRIYALAVCFASVMYIAISTGIALFDVVQISVPHLTVDSRRYHLTRSNTSYVYTSVQTGSPSMIQADGVPTTTPRLDMTEEEFAKRRERQRNLALERERHDAVRSLLQILAILIVSTPLFIVHWRLAKRLEAE